MWAQGARINDRSEAIVDGTYLSLRVATQDSYIVGQRGRVAIPIELDWGSDDELIELNAETFAQDCKRLLGYDYNDPKLKNVIEAINGGATTVFLYKLNHGEKAKGTFATAKCSGELGNTIDITVEQDPDAGVGDHPLKNTTCDFAVSEGHIDITIGNPPVNPEYQIKIKNDKGAEVASNRYEVNLLTSPIGIDLSPLLNDGKYTVEVYVNKLLLSTGSFTLSYVRATEAKMEPQLTGDRTDETTKEGADDVTVEFSVEGNKVVATYTGVTDQTPMMQVRMQVGGLLAEAKDRNTFKVEGNKASVTFEKFAAYKGTFTAVANVRTTDGKIVKIASQQFTVTKNGENKDAYTNPAKDSQVNEDYSQPVANRYIVTTTFNKTVVDTQKVQVSNDLVDNDYVVFDKSYPLKPIAGDNLSGGTNGTVTGADWEACRNLLETTQINTVAVPVFDETEQKVWFNWVVRLRDKYGIKTQIVMPYNENADKFNHEGVILFANTLNDADLSEDQQKTDLCYWLAGAEAGCAVNASCVAKAYNGVYDVNANVTMAQQEWAINNGLIMLHLVDGVPTIGKDINTLTEITPEYEGEKNLQFKQNQAIRVLDAITVDTANIFNRYFLGKVPNDEAGRSDLKSRIIRNREAYAAMGAIDTYDSSNLTINQGDYITDVVGQDAIRFMNVMEYLFFTIEVLG